MIWLTGPMGEGVSFDQMGMESMDDEISGITEMMVGSTTGTSYHGGPHTGGRGNYRCGSHGGNTSLVRGSCSLKLGHYASNCTTDLATIQAKLAQ